MEKKKKKSCYFFSSIFSTLHHTCNTKSSMHTFFPRAAYHFTSLSQANSPKPKISYKTQYFPQLLARPLHLPSSNQIATKSSIKSTSIINNHYWQHGAPIVLPILAGTLPPNSKLSVFIEVLFLKTQKELSG